MVHLLHALGNTGSKTAVRVLLRYLKEEDLDVQMTAVSSLRMHLNSERVQKALVQLLEKTKQEEVCLPHQRQQSLWHPRSMAILNAIPFLSVPCSLCVYSSLQSTSYALNLQCLRV